MKKIFIAKKYQSTFRILTAALFSLIIVFGALVYTTFFSEKTTPHYASAGNISLTAIIEREPKPPSVRTYAPGQAMELRVGINFQYCANQGGNGYGRWKGPGPKDGNLGGWSGTTNAQLSSRTKSGDTYNFVTEYSKSFRAPMEDGVYEVRYQVGAESGQGSTGLSSERRAVFRVKTPPPPPPPNACPNLGAYYPVVPRGYVQLAGPICVPEGDLGLTCDVSDGQIEPGGTVTFTAETDTEATFKWFDGVSVSGTPAKTTTGLSSTLTRTYNEKGIFLVSVLAQAGGEAQQCTRGVVVRDEDEDISDYIDDLADLLNMDNAFIDDDGNIFFLDPSAGPATIDFGFNGNGLTNTTCEAVWNAQNVLKCDLYRNDELLKEIDASGTDDVEPGSYYIQCLALRDGAEVQSEVQVCRLNPGSSEI